MPEHSAEAEVCADPLLLCGGRANDPLPGVSPSLAAWLPPAADGASIACYRRAFSLF